MEKRDDQPNTKKKGVQSQKLMCRPEAQQTDSENLFGTAESTQHTQKDSQPKSSRDRTQQAEDEELGEILSHGEQRTITSTEGGNHYRSTTVKTPQRDRSLHREESGELP